MINNNKFLCVSSEYLYKINYVLSSEKLSNNRNGLISFTGDNCQTIFEENNVPSEYQLIFIKIISKNKGFEYLTNIPFKLTNNYYYEDAFRGEMSGSFPGCSFNYSDYCTKEEIINFMSNLKNDGLLENYIQSLGEIFQVNILTNKNNFIKKNNGK